MEFLRSLASAYMGLLRRFGSILAVLLMSAAASLIVVYPLWAFATRSRRAYTMTMLVVLGSGLGVMIVSRVVNHIRADRLYLSRRLLPAIRTTCYVGGLLVGAYGAVWFYARGLYGAAIPLTLLFAVAVGVLGRAHRF